MKAKSILLATVVTLGAFILPTLPASAHDRGHHYGKHRTYYGSAPSFRPAPYQKVYYRDYNYYYTRPYGYYQRQNGPQINIRLGN